MENIKINVSKIFAGIFVLALLASCDDDRGYDDYDAGTQPLSQMSGEWWIDIIDEATGEVVVQHALHRTFDANNGRMFISDRDYSDTTLPFTFNGWWLVSEVDVNPHALTFSATDEENTADGSLVNITEGKILKNAGHSLSGVATDSIYFKAEFDYDPGTVLIFSGHKRTGFIEDEF